MNTYKLVIAYDGTEYHGWQIQRDAVSIAGTLEKRYRELFGHDIQLVGASRTDTGVHALGQVARFKTPLSIEPDRFRRSWNAHLPHDIHIRSLVRVDENFHPQRNVIQKLYHYYFSSHRPLPFIARYVLAHGRPFNVESLRDALAVFVGTHDFRSFCTGNDYEDTTRTIHAIECDFLPRYQVYRVSVYGPGFLRYQIRRMVGGALAVASKDRPAERIREVLEQKNPAHHLPTAPGNGLVLRKIIYK